MIHHLLGYFNKGGIIHTFTKVTSLLATIQEHSCRISIMAFVMTSIELPGKRIIIRSTNTFKKGFVLVKNNVLVKVSV